MTKIKITDNDSFRRYVTSVAVKKEISIDAICLEIAEKINIALPTVKGWLLISNPKRLTPRNIALIQKAIDDGRLPL